MKEIKLTTIRYAQIQRIDMIKHTIEMFQDIMNDEADEETTDHMRGELLRIISVLAGQFGWEAIKELFGEALGSLIIPNFDDGMIIDGHPMVDGFEIRDGNTVIGIIAIEDCEY